MIQLDKKEFEGLKALKIAESCMFQGLNVTCLNYNYHIDNGCDGCVVKNYYDEDECHCPLENDCNGKIYKVL